ncbi:LAMI_0H08570g1_1 [Lachancea mirantina]|uniref:Transcription initiation factor IIF subunit alpha n=1 Tax=Lachancea mirantina TaxID=1230905 RepID=A0A1G4KGJ4_9SACH|nr:LAMI_0H08570g1_1 [Lachancea mirantina]
MSNPLKPSGGGASPFIKREQLRRDFLRSRMKKSSTPKPFVKREDPDVVDANLGRVLHDGGLVGDDMGVRVKGEHSNDYNEFPLRAATSKTLDNVRTHILKFQSKKKINPVEDFHLPIRLHRKDTRNLQFQLTRAEIVQRQKEIAEFRAREMGNTEDGKPNESMNATPSGAVVTVSDASPTPGPASASETQVKSEDTGTVTTEGTRAVKTEDAVTVKVEDKPLSTKLEEAGPSADPTKVGLVTYDGKEKPMEVEQGKDEVLAEVAPDGGGRFRRQNSKRKTRQLKLLDENAKRLRFEEFYPWVMEDYDGLNTWVGSYEAGNSDSYVLLSVENDGSFTMIPADKVYKFTARNKYATLTIDEAEKRMEKNGKGIPRWLMKHLDDIGTTTTRYDRTKRRLRAVDARHGDEEDRADNSEVELDFDEEFADDEEAPIIDGDEKENRESEQRIKKEMLQANAMGLRDETEIDDEELLGEKKIDNEGERVMKALQKSDMAALYESDDESKLNPYLSESENENNEENAVKKEEDDDEKNSRKSSPTKRSRESSSTPQIHVRSIKDCVIVLKADKKILGKYPPGNWNPGAQRPKSEEPQKLPKNSAPGEEQGEDPALLTEQDIVEAVQGNKMTLKQLIRDLKSKVALHPSNKDRMKLYVRKLLKLNNGYLELNK